MTQRMNKGIIFDFIRCSFHDGPGIRTVVFLKGCPLHCVWCQNPESQRLEPELLYDKDKCLNCGECVEFCENKAHFLKDGIHIYLKELCVGCGKCVEHCPVGAIKLAGYETTDDEVIEMALEDRLFYENSGGGLTISGGEPLMQHEFTVGLLKKAKANGLHTCLDTCGYAPIGILKIAMQYTDIFLFDIKETDERRHRQYAGVGLDLILNNLKFLDSKGKNIILRCPIIPGINDRLEHMETIRRLVKKYHNISKIELLKYHELGNDKYRLLGRTISKDILKECSIDIKIWEKRLEEELINRSAVDVN